MNSIRHLGNYTGPRRGVTRIGMLAAVLIVAGAWLVLAPSAVRERPGGHVTSAIAAEPVVPTHAPSGGSVQASPSHPTPIEQIALGQRVAGRNPEVSEQERADFLQVDPETWRLVRLELTKPDGSLLRVGLLRPEQWLLEQDARIGGRVFLDLNELGAVGWAEVVGVGPCPAVVGDQAGGVVTGTFEHLSGEVLDLQLSGVEPIGVTASHPFWSSDRHEFVPAGQLRVGERVVGLSGLHAVESIRPRDGPTPVYNLEVNGEHVYRVASVGVLVHNNGCPTVAYHGTDVESGLALLNGRNLDQTIASSRKIDGPEGFFLATHVEDAEFFAMRRGRGTVLEFHFSDRAVKELNAAGVIRQAIPGGPKSPRFFGDGLIIHPERFDLFNRLRGAGHITILPADF